MSQLKEVGTWAAFAAEVARFRPRKAPRILAAALNAKIQANLPPGKVTASGLWRQPFSSVGDYVAYWGAGQLHEALRLVNWQGNGRRLVEDKLITTERYFQRRIAAIPILAVIGRDEEAHPHSGLFKSIRSPSDVTALLQSRSEDLIIKPAAGSRGGDVRLLRPMGANWELGSDQWDPDQLAARLLEIAPPEGFLLQPRLQSHPSLQPIGGDFGLNTIRINTALLRDAPKFLFHFVKIMGRPGVIDNFAGGKHGNLIAALDITTGRIVEAFGRHPRHKFLLTEMTHHPLTGTPLIGFQVPQWQEAIKLALSAAECCPETPLVGADVAITEDGPKMVEINAAWDADYPELFARKGLRKILSGVWHELQLDDDVKAEAGAMLRVVPDKAAKRLTWAPHNQERS